MDKQQILTAAVVAALVISAAVYRVLWMGGSAAAGAGLRQFPKTPGKMLKWFFGGGGGEKDHQAQSPTGSGQR
jgi:hypothetical protein